MSSPSTNTVVFFTNCVKNTLYAEGHWDNLCPTGKVGQMNQTKMTVKVFSGMQVAFNAQMQRLPIKRDAFLNSVIRTETSRLSQAMQGKRLSSKVNRYISGQLARLGTTTVNIVVDKDVADALNAVVRESNIVRDAFMNRLIAFLRSSDSLLKYLGLPLEHTAGKIGKWIVVDPIAPTSPMKTLEEVFSDPLYVLHESAKQLYDGMNLYLLDLPSPKWDGLACFLDDSIVPGTRAHRKNQQEMEALMQGLEDLELETLAPTCKAEV
jgi:hypothetical protein